METKMIKKLKQLYKAAKHHGTKVEKIFSKDTITPIDFHYILQYGLTMGGIMGIVNQATNYIKPDDIKSGKNPKIYKKLINMNKQIGTELVNQVTSRFVTISNAIENQSQIFETIMSRPPSNKKH